MSDKLVKVKIAPQPKTDEYDDLLEIYLEDVTDALKPLLLINEDPPQSSEHIVRVVAVKKSNWLKNEGTAFYSQDGEGIAFNSNDSDDFRDEIEHYHQDNSALNQGTRVNPYEV